MMKRNRIGFTLIELLIVVAIIGILAAIAIPNFLQAQVRAKVARVKSEHATVGTALEMYRVDSNAYPNDWIPTSPPMWPYYLPTVLTSPIDYMSSNALFDPFPTAGWSPGDVATRYRYKNLGTGTGVWDPVPSGTIEDRKQLGMWVLYSNGPYRRLALPPGFADGANPGDWFWIPYDPTNGTVSRGCIIRSQKDSEVLEYD